MKELQIKELSVKLNEIYNNTRNQICFIDVLNFESKYNIYIFYIKN